ncbi:hypothetical protein NE237_024292 [Protea cynaroides]|uniref:Cytochrome P450 n=1 Tax=Protea cynaroides TaxID=273540 RepID=A0A9Q0K6Z6_9MAGN|nr:hypothetical protein NE237_024292 [Protea cynaroides]
MELLFQFQTIASLLTLALFFYLWSATYFNKGKQPTEAPEPPGAWPIIGHLLQLKSPQFGVHRTFIINSWELAKECFTTNDRALASRPRSASSSNLSYNYALMALAPYGPTGGKYASGWFMSYSRTADSRHSSISIWLWMKNNRNHIKVEMNRVFRDLTLNIVLKIIVGKRYFSVVNVENNEENQRIQSTITEYNKYISDSVRIAKEADMLTETWLQEHRQKRLPGKADGDDQQDFMDVMMSILEDESQLYGHDRDSIVKATTLVIIIAATDTTAISLSWALSLLLNHKKVLTKAVDELELYVGKDRNVEEKDIANLVHGRLHFKWLHSPKRTQVLVNVWKIYRDPRFSSNPLEFQHERFLTTHADVDIMPGFSFALQTILMTLARLLHGFNLQTPSDLPVDMTEATGITMSKKNPLEVLLSPRLPSHLHEQL